MSIDTAEGGAGIPIYNGCIRFINSHSHRCYYVNITISYSLELPPTLVKYVIYKIVM